MKSREGGRGRVAACNGDFVGRERQWTSKVVGLAAQIPVRWNPFRESTGQQRACSHRCMSLHSHRLR